MDPFGSILFYTTLRRPRFILAEIITALAIGVFPHAGHKHQHFIKGCNTSACNHRVGDWWYRKTHKFKWHKAGASIYGEPCEAGNLGYRGANLNDHPWSFAELDMGTALGDLPAGTAIQIRSPATHKITTIEKLDIGEGGGDVEGIPRRIDLYAPVAKWLANADCNWTGVVEWARK